MGKTSYFTIINTHLHTVCRPAAYSCEGVSAGKRCANSKDDLTATLVHSRTAGELHKEWSEARVWSRSADTQWRFIHSVWLQHTFSETNIANLINMTSVPLSPVLISVCSLLDLFSCFQWHHTCGTFLATGISWRVDLRSPYLLNCCN